MLYRYCRITPSRRRNCLHFSENQSLTGYWRCPALTDTCWSKRSERENMEIFGKTSAEQLPWETALAGQLQHLSWLLWITRYLSPNDIPSWITSSYSYYLYFPLVCNKFLQIQRLFKHHECIITSQFNGPYIWSQLNWVSCWRSD